jgi:uncharacterized protein (TIGR02145 family)
MKTIRFPVFSFLLVLFFGLSQYSCKKSSTEPQDNAKVLETGTFTDSRDNRIYSWVKIGSQTWMSENLNYNTMTGSWVYSNDTNNAEIYGRLYDWETACAVCPAGWHMPSDSEWTVLTDYLESNGYGCGGSGDDIAKSIAATSNWIGCDSAGTVGNEQNTNNSSGFSGLPGGGCVGGGFGAIRFSGYWWSSSEYNTDNAYCRFIHSNGRIVYRDNYSKSYGLSVRCVKD